MFEMTWAILVDRLGSLPHLLARQVQGPVCRWSVARRRRAGVARRRALRRPVRPRLARRPWEAPARRGFTPRSLFLLSVSCTSRVRHLSPLTLEDLFLRDVSSSASPSVHQQRAPVQGTPGALGSMAFLVAVQGFEAGSSAGSRPVSTGIEAPQGMGSRAHAPALEAESLCHASAQSLQRIGHECLVRGRFSVQGPLGGPSASQTWVLAMCAGATGHGMGRLR